MIYIINHYSESCNINFSIKFNNKYFKISNSGTGYINKNLLLAHI